MMKMPATNSYAATIFEHREADRTNHPIWLFVALFMVANFSMEILYVGQIRLNYMLEQPAGYATFQLAVLVFALLVGSLNLKRSAAPEWIVFRASGRTVGGLILGCSFFEAEPVARWMQNLVGYHPSHNYVIFILMLTISIVSATVVERGLRRVFRMIEGSQP